MAKRIQLSLDKSSGHYQISLSVLDADNVGHGYRLMGPKYIGNSLAVKEVDLGQRDADEIRAILDEVFPPAAHPVLDLPMGKNDANAATVREYLTKLLADVWEYGEGFDGKRPFGNSSWEYELYRPLGRAGLIEVTLDEDGYIATFPDSEQGKANELIHAAIRELGRVAG